MTSTAEGTGLNGDLIGFLSFHREIIAYYRRVARREGRRQRPFTKRELMHPFHAWIDGLGVAESFSEAIEDWHNFLHRDHSDPDFMDPKKNIYMPDFWRLHQFINNRFTNWMRKNKEKYQPLNHSSV